MQLTGSAAKGPLRGATITLHKSPGNPVASTQTDASGNFAFTADAWTGSAFLTAQGGTYIDEQTGQTLTLSGQLTGLVSQIQPGNAYTDVRVTPLSNLVVRRALALGAFDQPTLDRAANEIGALLGGLDPGRTAPVSPLGGIAVEGRGGDYGLLLGGISRWAQQLGVAPETLADALASDLADGVVDGRASGQPVIVLSTDLSKRPVTGELLENVVAFALSPRNAAGLQPSENLIHQLSQGDGPLPDGTLPVADVGADQTVDVDTVCKLTGSVASRVAGQVGFRWKLVEGPDAVALSSDTAASPTFTPALPGIYLFELTVSDAGRESKPARARVVARGAAGDLHVRAVACAPGEVVRGQPFALQVSVQNIGKRAVSSVVVTPTFRTLAQVPLPSQYAVTAATASPGSIAAGATAVLNFTAVASATATLGEIVADAGATGTDAAGTPTADPSADLQARVLVQAQAAPVIESIAAPSIAEMGRTVRVSAVVRNDGFARAEITSLTLSFKDAGGTDRSAQYSVTPVAGNPTQVAGGARATLAFDVAVSLGATAGSITVDGTVAFKDLVTGATGTKAGAQSPAFWTVVIPKIVYVEQVSGPGTVSRGQTAAVTVRLNNATGAVATLGGVALRFSQGGADAGSGFTVTPGASNPATLSVGQIATLTFNVAVGGSAPTGSIGIDAAVTFTANGETRTQSGAPGAFAWTVQTAAALAIGALSGPSFVSQGQVATVAVPVTNSGEAALTNIAVTLAFANAGGQDRGVDYTVAPSASNPATLAGGASATLAFNVTVKGTAVPALTTVDAAGSGRDANSGLTITDGAASARLQWLVQTPGALSMLSAAGSRATISQGQTFSVTLTLRNTGGATVNLTSAGPAFTGAGGANRASSYAVTASASNPTTVPGGATVALAYTVVASASAPAEVVTIDGQAAGAEANSGATIDSGLAATKFTMTVQAVASLDILSTAGPSIVRAGTTVGVTMTVRNPGGAAAGIASHAPTFRRGGVDSASDYTVTVVSAPTAIAAGATSSFVYSVAIKASATLGATTVDGTVSGTDVNSGASISDGAATSAATWTFATPAVLSIASIAGPAKVTQGQTAGVTMTVANTGGAPADLTASSLSFRAGATDVTGEYTVTPAAGNPTSVPAGQSVALRYTVTAGGSATTGGVTVDGAVSGTDAIFGGAVSDTGAASPLAWTVQTPPALAIAAILLAPAVTQGQTTTITVTVANSGQATANLATTSVTFTGGADRTGEYTVTPVAGNPAAVAGGASAALRFTVGVGAGATAESVALTARTDATDANTGAAVSGTGPASPPAWTVQTPPALSVTALTATPATISQGQTFGVTLTVANGGQALARITGSKLAFNVSGTDRTSQYAVTASGGNPTQVAGGGSATLNYTVAAGGSATAGIADVTGSVTATDANSAATVAGSGPALPFALTVQRPAALDVVAVTGPATISQGQTRNVTVTVRNTGDATATGASTALTLKVGGTDRTSEYTRTPVSGPGSITGGTTVTYVWQVVASITANTGSGTVDSSATGSDANSGASTSDGAATAPHAWTVQTSARLSIASILPAPAANKKITLGTTFPVTMNVANVGGNPATFTQALLTFTSGVTNRDADFTVFPRGSNPTGVNPGQTVPLVFDVVAALPAAPGTVDIDGGAHATDDVAGVTTGVTGTASRGRFTGEMPPALWFQSLSAPSLVSVGQTFYLTAVVRNQGGATAQLDSAALSFTATDTTARDSMFTVGVASPVLLAGGGAATSFSVPVTVSAGASTEDINAGGRIVGTDVNSGVTVLSTTNSSTPRFTLQTPAAIQVLAVTSSKSAVSQGQTAMLTATVQNTGQAAARPVSFLFSFTAGVTDRSADYAVTARAGNPATIPGGQSRAFAFDAAVSSSAALGPVAIDVAQATARDANSNALLSASGAIATTAWTVQRPAGIHVTDVSVSPGEVFQLETLFVTLHAENSGEASALVTATSVTFNTSGTNDTDGFLQTAAPDNPTSLSPGTTGSFRITVSVKESARTGLTVIDGQVRGRDANSDLPLADLTADVTTSARIKPFDPRGPRILYSNPSNGCLNVMTNTGVFVTFDRPMDGGTFTPDAFTLAKLGSPVTTLPISNVVRLDPARQTWELVVPSATFTPASTYAVLVSNRVKDVAGNPCQGDQFKFSTSIDKSSLGTAPPTTQTTRPDIFGVPVLWFNPPHQTHNLPTSTQLVVRWRAPVDPATVSTQSVRIFRVTTPVIELPLTSVAMEATPTATILITPSAALLDSTTYAVMITNNVREYTGFPVPTQNALFSTALQYVCGVAPPRNVTSTQPTPDETGPQIYFTNPPECSYNALDTSQLLVTFNQPVQASTIGASNFRIWEIDGPVRNAVGVASVTPYPSPPNTYRIAPASMPLTRGSSYLVSMDNRVTDTLGNRSMPDRFFFSAAIDHAKVKGAQNVSTVPTPDTTGPRWANVSLEPFSSGSPVCRAIQFQFTEPVTPSLITPNDNTKLYHIVIYQGTVFPETVEPIASVTPFGTNQFQIDTVFPLQFTLGDTQHVYVIMVNNRAVDAIGNASTGESFAFHYTNADGCSGGNGSGGVGGGGCGKAIVGFSPWHMKMNVTTDTRILVSFGEPAMASTISTNISLVTFTTLDEAEDLCASVNDFPQGQVNVPCTIGTVNVSNGTYEMIPQTNGGRLLVNQRYAVILSGFGLRRLDGTFFPANPLLNFAAFTTANDFIPVGTQTAPQYPDQSKVHTQRPPASTARLYATTIVASIPGLARHDQRYSSRVFVTLDGTIDPATIDERSLILQEWTNPPVQVPVSQVVPAPGPRPNTFEIIPSSPLSDGTTYSIHLTNRAESTTGTPALIDEVNFMTLLDTKRMALPLVPTMQPSPDFEGPLVAEFSPPRKANVHPANRVWMRFNEDVDAATVTVTPTHVLFTRDVDSPGATDMTRTVTVTPFGFPANTFLLTPSAGLADATTYGIFVTDNVRDQAGNFSSAHEIFFETRIDPKTMGSTIPQFATTNPQAIGPFIARANPDNGRISVPVESRILMTLSTDTDASNVSTGAFLRKIDPAPVADVMATIVPLSVPPRTYEIVPSVPLEEKTTYAVFLTNVVHDGEGKPSPTDEFYFRTEVSFPSVGSQTPSTWQTAPGYGPIFGATNPRNRRHNVQPETSVIVTFNRAISDLADPRSVLVAELTTPTPRRITLSGPITQLPAPADTYRIPVDSVDLVRESTFAVFLTNRVTDTSGLPSPGDSFQFSTTTVLSSMHATVPATERGDAAKWGAVLSNTSPGHARLNVSPDSRILFTFNTTVTGVDGTTVFVRGVPDKPTPTFAVPGTVALLAGDTYEFTPSSTPLGLATTYALFVTNGVKDGAGVNSPGDEFYFSTAVDTRSAGRTYTTSERAIFQTGPVLIGSSPSNGRHNVQTSTRILFTFNQAMNDATLDAGSVSLLMASTPVAQLPTLGVSARAAPPNSYELLVAPGVLTEATTYVVAINNRAQAADGTRCPGDEFFFSTTTVKESINASVPTTERADAARFGPVLLATNPANDERNVQPASRILFTFNTTVTDASVTAPGSIVFKKLEQPPETILASTVTRLSTPENTYELTAAPLTVGSTYCVFVTNRVETPDGTTSPGDEFQFSSSVFLTATNTNTVQVNPAHERLNIMRNTRVLLTFTKPVSASTLLAGGVALGPITTSTFTPMSLAAVVPVTMPANTYDVQYSGALSPNTTYGVIVTNLAADLDGEPLRGGFSTFATTLNQSRVGTTITSDVVREPITFGPVGAEFNPPHERVNVLPRTRMFVRFSAPVKDVSTSSVQLLRLSTPEASISLSAVVPLTYPSNMFEVVPSAPLSATTTYGLFVTNRVRALSDLASPGNDAWFGTAVVAASLGSEKYTTTVTSPDEVGPFIKLSNPNNKALNVPLNSALLLTFNESIRDSSILTAPNDSVALIRLTTPVIDLGPVTVTKETTPANTYRIQRSPPADLSPTTTYALVITNAIEDQLGNHAQPGSVIFSTNIVVGGQPSFGGMMAAATVSSFKLAGVASVTAAPLLVVSQLLMTDRLTIGEQAPVVITLRNTGSSPIAVRSVGLSFGAGARDGEFDVVPDPRNPASLAPNQTVAVGLSLTPRAGASAGPVGVAGQASGTDAATGRALSATSGSKTVELALPPQVSVRALAAPPYVRPGDVVDVRATVVNAGGAAARVTAVSLEFRAGVDRGGDYTVTSALALPAALEAGATLEVPLRVAVAADAVPFESVQLAFTPEAVSWSNGAALAVQPHPWAAWTVGAGAAPAALGGTLAGARLSGPGGMATDGRRFYLVDPANARVLVFAAPPAGAGDQPLFALGGPGGAAGPLTFARPAGIACDGTRLALADAGHNRVLIWDELPAGPSAAPARVLGQRSMAAAAANSGGASAATLNAPAAVRFVGDRLFVADTGNNRVLAFAAGGPAAGALAELVLGQPSFSSTGANTGGLSRASLAAPAALAWDGAALWIADTGNRRVLGWDGAPAAPADAPHVVLGQADFASAAAGEHPAPAGLDAAPGRLYVTDRRDRTVRMYLRDAAAPLAGGSLRSVVLVPYTGGPALAAPEALLALPGRLYLADPPADRVLVIGR